MNLRPPFDIVIPTLGRPSLDLLLHALARQQGPRPQWIFLVDDRVAPGPPLAQFADEQRAAPSWLAERLRTVDGATVPGERRGPAAARNRGWRRSRAEWIVFLDDDVLPPLGWLAQLGRDLESVDADPRVAGSSGQIVVPLPQTRRPTDWERDVAGLEHAVWATADMAYRRTVLDAVNGFDEGFPLAYREDADLGLRVTEAGYSIVPGARRIIHPVRPASWWISVPRQRGNASDARMRVKHGRDWRVRAHVPRGRFSGHVATTACAAAAAGAVTLRRFGLARAAFGLWLGAMADFAWRRIAPGPRTVREVLTLVATSICISPVAVWYRLRGELRERRNHNGLHGAGVDVVLVDRDGTIVVDRPYNGDPARVVPVTDARDALDALRARGIAIGVVSNQSGVARGVLTRDQVDAVNARVEALLGPFAGWWYCPHDDAAECGCRKPAPGLIRAALRHFGVDTGRCAVVGDTGADVAAAHAAGVRGILVPNDATRVEEVERARDVAPSLRAAVDMLIGGQQ